MNNGIYNYFVGKSEPPGNWKDIGFDDTSWQKADSSVIGYGWPKVKVHSMDSVVIEKTTSLYLRIKFSTNTPEHYGDLNFDADFDDAFIIYLNGEEIARKNIGKPGDFIPFNRLADRSNEAIAYRSYSYPVNGIYIDSTTVKRLVTKGENVFAVHVVNDSANGSDLSFMANVYNLKDCGQFNWSSGWVRYYKQVPLKTSKFPIVFIDTDEFGIPSTNFNKEVIASMKIIDKKSGTNSIDDAVDFESQVKIERRGESSLGFAKMSFNVETQNKDGKNMDTSLLGMPSDNDWILFSGYADKTLIRNELTFYIGRRLGHYEPRTQYCELILNGEYQGLYVFMEKIKRGKQRVNVAKRDTINPAEGGFVFKYDKPTAGSIQYVYPKKKDITKKEKDYINAFRDKCFKVLKSDYYMDPDSGYKKYFSTKSLIDNVMINELTKNCDAYLYSTYFHKDKDSDDGRLKYGPLWDFDLAYCGASWHNGNLTYGWQFAEYNSKHLHIKELFKDTALVHEYASRWFSLRKSFLADDAFFEIIDSLTYNIEESRTINYDVWPIIEKQYVWPVYATYSYEDDVNLIKKWVSERMKWIDNNIGYLYQSDSDTVKLEFSNTQISVYPNPCIDNITIKLLGETGDYQISIQNLYGITISEKRISSVEGDNIEIQFSNSDFAAAKTGVYFIMVLKDGQVVQAKKIIKAAPPR